MQARQHRNYIGVPCTVHNQTPGMEKKHVWDTHLLRAPAAVLQGGYQERALTLYWTKTIELLILLNISGWRPSEVSVKDLFFILASVPPKKKRTILII